MAHIGFLLIMAGLAATGGAIDMGTGLAAAVSMTAAGAALMWFFREEDEDGEEKDNSSGPGSGSHVDRPASEGAGRPGADPAGGGGTGIPDADDCVSSWDGNHDRAAPQAGDLRSAGGVGRENRAGMEMHGL